MGRGWRQGWNCVEIAGAPPLAAGHAVEPIAVGGLRRSFQIADFTISCAS